MNIKTIFAIIAALILSACAPNYSSGDRVGVVTKLSNKGLVWKSWEGSLNQGGTKVAHDSDGNTQIVPNAIDFNVQDEAVIQTLQAAADSGQRVKIRYEQWLIAPPRIENDRVVVSAVILK